MNGKAAAGDLVDRERAHVGAGARAGLERAVEAEHRRRAGQRADAQRRGVDARGRADEGLGHRWPGVEQLLGAVVVLRGDEAGVAVGDRLRRRDLEGGAAPDVADVVGMAADVAADDLTAGREVVDRGVEREVERAQRARADRRTSGHAAAEVDGSAGGGAVGSDLDLLRRGVVAEVPERAPEPVADGPGGIVALQGALDVHDRAAPCSVLTSSTTTIWVAVSRPGTAGSGVPISSRSSAAMSTGSGASSQSAVAPLRSGGSVSGRYRLKRLSSG